MTSSFYGLVLVTLAHVNGSGMSVVRRPFEAAGSTRRRYIGYESGFAIKLSLVDRNVIARVPLLP